MTESKAKILLCVASLIVTSTAAYVLWDILVPPRVFPAGTTKTPKAELYGWALEPYRSYSSPNPDTGRPISFGSNSAGWRDIDHKLEKPHGLFRIVIIGDSVTVGSVALESLYTRQLERILKETGMVSEVISMGVGGWSTDQEMEALRLEGIQYQPDLVILQYCGNDIYGNQGPYIGAEKKGIQWKKPFRYELSADNQLIRIQPMVPNDEVPSLAKGLPLLQALYREIKAISGDAKADMLMFSESQYAYLRELCDGVPMDCYIPQRAYTRYKSDSHFNAIGNTEIAMDLANYIFNRYRPELTGFDATVRQN